MPLMLHSPAVCCDRCTADHELTKAFHTNTDFHDSLSTCSHCLSLLCSSDTEPMRIFEGGHKRHLMP